MALKILDMNQLDHVVGGFAEASEGLPTAGMEIACPSCNNSDKNYFSQSALYDPDIGSVEYRCSCGCKFVCYKGKVILREEWDALCKQKGINYKF